jgi:hypothetical protein
MGAEEQFREELWEVSLVVSRMSSTWRVETGGIMNTTDVSRAA